MPVLPRVPLPQSKQLELDALHLIKSVKRRRERVSLTAALVALNGLVTETLLSTHD